MKRVYEVQHYTWIDDIVFVVRNLIVGTKKRNIAYIKKGKFKNDN